MLYGKTSSFEVRAVGQMQAHVFNHIAKLSICDRPFPSLLTSRDVASVATSCARQSRAVPVSDAVGCPPQQHFSQPPRGVHLARGSLRVWAPGALRDTDSSGPGTLTTSNSFSPSSFPGSSHTPLLVTLHKL